MSASPDGDLGTVAEVRDTPSQRGALGRVAVFVAIVGIGVAWIALSENDVSWAGLVAMLVFYAFFYWLGAFYARRKGGTTLGDTMVAGRSLPLRIAVVTMTATWVGGAYVAGSAEAAYASGLAWVQAPWGFALSLVVGGIFFAPRMRRGRFLTMLDPIDIRFGRNVAGMSAIPALMGEVFWSAAILTALGTTFGTILGIDFVPSIILSAAIAIAYTVVGGMWSVVITDVAQCGVIFLGLLVAAPFAVSAAGGWDTMMATYSEGMGPYASLFPPLTGWDDPAWGASWWNWWDFMLLLVMGGIPWQVYFQRVLAAKDEHAARWLSIGAGLLCIVAAVPAVLIGVAAFGIDFAALGAPPVDNPALAFSHTLRYALPGLVAAVGLGAMAAAVMSSVDSSILSASSLGGWNVYRGIVRRDATAAQVGKVIKRLVVIIGVAATLLALNVSSVYELWYLSSDLVYVLLFPQLVCAMFVPFANRTGAVAALVVGAFLRFGGGEPAFGLPAFLPYPWVVDGVSLFPFRTLAMVASLLALLAVSWLTRRLNAPVPLAALGPEAPERARSISMESA